MTNNAIPTDGERPGFEGDDDRHYLKDADELDDGARDEDERDQHDILEIDQAELEELGLTLDDPHQPESE